MLDIDFKHLHSVKAGYFKHFAFAMYFNALALLILLTGLIHAVFPFLFAFTPYKLAKKITDGVENGLIRDSNHRHNS